MSLKRSLIGCALLMLALEGVAIAGQSRQGTWSARVGTGTRGPALQGTWTATPDAATGAVTGTWTVLNAQGKVVLRGAWSATKAAKGWTGSWRATVDRRKGEYSGTWRADLKLKADMPFADLFASAVSDVVSGSWRAAGRSGRWSIRASE